MTDTQSNKPDDNTGSDAPLIVGTITAGRNVNIADNINVSNGRAERLENRMRIAIGVILVLVVIVLWLVIRSVL